MRAIEYFSRAYMEKHEKSRSKAEVYRNTIIMNGQLCLSLEYSA